MKLPSRYSVIIILSALMLSMGFLLWVDRGRMERVEYVSGLGAEEAVPDPTSVTGWTGNRRWLIASEHNNDSYQWIMETQQMLASGDWRLRRVSYDNAPKDREVSTSAPYHWWLALVAKVERAYTGTSPPLSVERAALIADPLLLVLFLLVGVALISSYFGPWPAAVFVVGGSVLYPFSAIFSPGAPDHLGLSIVLGFASVLFAAAGNLLTHATRAPRAGLWLAAAGVAGGLGLWVNLFVQLPILLGLALSGMVVAWNQKMGPEPDMPRAWFIWGVAGAITSLAAYVVEYFPSPLDWELKGNHPLVAIAWLGAGELVSLLAAQRSGRKPFPSWIPRGKLVLAVLAVGALPYVIWKSDIPWLQGREVFGTRLTSLPLAGAASSFGAWLAQDGIKLQTVGVILPLLCLSFPIWLAWRRSTARGDRVALTLVLGPLLLSLPFAWMQLRWWSLVDGLLLALAVTVTLILVREGRRGALMGWLGVWLFVLLPGMICQIPAAREKYTNELTQFEVEGIVERSIAHWLAGHSDKPPLILAPPFRTMSLCFHGNMRGIGSLNWENKEAMSAAARIASATSPDEALALINNRGVTHIIMPSWDAYLEEYARIFTSRPENSFVYGLKQWVLPLWLTPVAYQLPTIGGFDGQAAVIFEVTEEQDQATTLSRLVEYFIEMGQMQLALAAGKGLEIYPQNLPALATIAQLELARGDATHFNTVFTALISNYSSTEEHDLSWDRRVSLAVVLMQGKRTELARREMGICLNLMDEAKLRSLSISSLYRFQVMLNALNLKIDDARLQALAKSLLPEALRSRL